MCRGYGGVWRVFIGPSVVYRRAAQLLEGLHHPLHVAVDGPKQRRRGLATNLKDRLSRGAGLALKTDVDEELERVSIAFA